MHINLNFKLKIHRSFKALEEMYGRIMHDLGLYCIVIIMDSYYYVWNFFNFFLFFVIDLCLEL